MKRVLVIIAVAAIIMFSGNYYYGRQVEKRLDSMAQVVRAMGGKFEYSDVTIGLGGDVRVDDVRVSAPQLSENLIIDRVVLRTGSVLGVHHLAMDVRKKRLPEQLGLSVEGARIPMGGAGYQQWSAAGAQGGEGLAVAGCGKRAHFSDVDYTKMGYRSFMVIDTHLDYRLSSDGRSLALAIRSATEDMHDVAVKVDLSLNAPSRDMTAIGLALAGAELNEVRVDYEDRGFVERALDFCQEAVDLERSEFLVEHLRAWQDAWHASGFVAGENTVAAYRHFLEQPEHFAVSARPGGSLSLTEMADTAPELLLYQFQTTLEVNHVAAGRLDLSVMDEAAVKAWRVERGDQTAAVEPKAKPTVEPRRSRGRVVPKAIAVEDLRTHLNAHVILQLTNGKTVEGSIRELEESTLHLQSYQSGGSITMPIDYDKIAEAHVTWKP